MSDAQKAPAPSETERAVEVAGVLNALMSELWWCASQLKCDWKDEEWRKRSSVGRAYDAGLALSRSLKGEG